MLHSFHGNILSHRLKRMFLHLLLCVANRSSSTAGSNLVTTVWLWNSISRCAVNYSSPLPAHVWIKNWNACCQATHERHVVFTRLTAFYQNDVALDVWWTCESIERTETEDWKFLVSYVTRTWLVDEQRGSCDTHKTFLLKHFERQLWVGGLHLHHTEAYRLGTHTS